MAKANISIPRVQSQDREINQLQNNIINGLAPVISLPFVGGVILSGVQLTAGQTTVQHGLNRNLIGWIVIGQNAQASVWDSQDSNKTPNQTLVLNASAQVTVNLFVF
jgi:hypothetical protein